MDLVVHTPRMPNIGETIIGSNFMTACGGKGGNQALAAARLGGQVSMLGCVGEDAFGPELRANLESAGVDTSHVHTTRAAASGTATIVVYEGDNFIIIDPGANHEITREHVQAFRDVIRESDIVLIQLEIPLDIVAETVRVSGECGTPVLLNPAPAAELDHETLRGITWFTPNEGEAAMMAGFTDRAGGGHGAPGESAKRGAAAGRSDPPDGHDAETLIRALQGKGVSNVCITRGAHGVAYAEGDGPVVLREAPAVTPVDTTAAGDVFSGALAVALTEGKAVDAAIEFAQRASAISVTRHGAGPSIPTRDEVK